MAADDREHFPHFGTNAIHTGQEPEQWSMNQVIIFIIIIYNISRFHVITLISFFLKKNVFYRLFHQYHYQQHLNN